MLPQEMQSVGDRILLHHTPTWWIAEFRGPVGESVKAIAGADSVRTGFNGCVPGPVVRQAIALLNPSAEVSLSGAAGIAQRQPTRQDKKPKASPIAPSTPRDGAERILGLAAEVARKHAELERAIDIKKSCGLLVACSYLREKGWSFEAAHLGVLELLPRVSETPSTRERPKPRRKLAARTFEGQSIKRTVVLIAAIAAALASPIAFANCP
jgi:hypothetical protein